MTEKLDYLVSARPTAVNIARAAADLKAHIRVHGSKDSVIVNDMKSYLIKEIEGMLQKDIDDNVKIGSFGRNHIMKSASEAKVKVLTHCNTGSLATVKYGTALGVIRCLHEQGMLVSMGQLKLREGKLFGYFMARLCVEFSNLEDETLKVLG